MKTCPVRIAVAASGFSCRLCAALQGRQMSASSTRLHGGAGGEGAGWAGGSAGREGGGGALSQLELDVGSLLGAGDENSWDCPPAREGSGGGGPTAGSRRRGEGGQAPPAGPASGLSAFHQLFPPSSSGGGE